MINFTFNKNKAMEKSSKPLKSSDSSKYLKVWDELSENDKAVWQGQILHDNGLPPDGVRVVDYVVDHFIKLMEWSDDNKDLNDVG